MEAREEWVSQDQLAPQARPVERVPVEKMADQEMTESQEFVVPSESKALAVPPDLPAFLVSLELPASRDRRENLAY